MSVDVTDASRRLQRSSFQAFGSRYSCPWPLETTLGILIAKMHVVLH